MSYLRNIFILLVLVGTVVSCSDYNKVLKSKDPDEKLSAAHSYYDKEEWPRAAALFEDVIPHFKYTPKGDRAYYRYAMCHYNMKDYYLAAFYLKKYSKEFPTSNRAEDARFLSAMCKVKNSPHYSLDQEETEQALDELQLFIDDYPNSKLIDSCNNVMDELRSKLELKQYETSKLYFKMENYRASVTSLKSTLQQFPSTKYKEDILYMLVKSSFLLAKNSIEAKKQERYEDTIKSYHKFVGSFPDSKKRDEIEDYYKRSKDYLLTKEESEKNK